MACSQFIGGVRFSVRSLASIFTFVLLGLTPALWAADPCAISLDKAAANLSKSIKDGTLTRLIGSASKSDEIASFIQFEDRRPHVLVKGSLKVDRREIVDAALQKLPKDYLVVEVTPRTLRGGEGIEANLRELLKDAVKRAEGLPAIVFVVRDVAELSFKPRDSGAETALDVFKDFNDQHRAGATQGVPRLILLSEGDVTATNNMLAAEKDFFNEVLVTGRSLEDTRLVAKQYAENLERTQNIKVSEDAIERAVASSDVATRPESARELISAAVRDKRSSLGLVATGTEDAGRRLEALQAELRPLQQQQIEYQSTIARLEEKQRSKTLSQPEALQLSNARAKMKDSDQEKGLPTRIADLQGRINSLSSNSPIVTAADIDAVVRRRAGKGDGLDRSNDPEWRRRAREAAKHLGAKVVGQPRALEIAESIAVSLTSGAQRPGRPLATILFVGPTRTGKTLLSREMAKFIFGSKDALVKFDGANFNTSHSGSQLLGAPPGYVGYEAGGQLTNALRENPMRFILLDEIEKFHPDVIRQLLPTFDVGGSGKIKDGMGREADVDQSIFAMTSNFGVALMQQKLEEFKAPYRQKLLELQDRSQKKKAGIEASEQIIAAWKMRLQLEAMAPASLTTDQTKALSGLKSELGDWPAPNNEGPVEYFSKDLELQKKQLEEIRLERKAVEREMINAAAQADTIDSAEFIEEFKERYLNQPYGDLWHKISALAYTTHPYQWPTIGKELKHVEDATLQDVQAFFNKFYSPNNAIMVVAGNVKKQQVEQLAHKWFGDIPANNLTTRTYAKEPQQPAARFLETKADVPANTIVKAYHMGNRNSNNYFVIDIASDILSSGSSSRLYQELVKKEQLFSEIECYLTGTADEGLVIVEGKLTENVTIENASKAIDRELQKMKQEKISAHELQKMKNRMESHNVLGELNLLTRAMNLAYYEFLGDAARINTEINTYQQITPENILDQSQLIFTENNCSTVHYLSNN
jgi:hypothetical protein